ncbi:MAG: hypothetical protein ND895_14110 [Pyrinomonadaceae bacterium]|nr:hypothetical protein [Pyrinomonadaceae bacterium]
MKLNRLKSLLIALALLGVGNLGYHNPVLAQETRPAPAQTPARPDYVLRISTKDLITVSLKAEKIPLSSIAGELSKKLKVPVLLGSSAGKRQVTTDFKSLTLEPAMQLLAPLVYIDYEVNRIPGAPPQPVGIYLNDEEDAAPAINAVVPNNSQAMLIEGNTEDGVETSEAAQKEQPLKVTYERSALTVKAKQQPLAVVLYKIASELSIPFEMKGDAAEVVDLDINKASLEDAVVRMSPNVRLFVRADLRRLERRPFLMVLVAPKG